MMRSPETPDPERDKILEPGLPPAERERLLETARLLEQARPRIEGRDGQIRVLRRVWSR